MPNYPKYTEEEIQFLREYYPTHSINETYDAFCEKFGEYTKSQVLHRIKKYHIKNNNDARFKKGMVVWNRGISIKKDRPELYEKYKQLNHDAFVKSGKPYWNKAKPIGTVIIDKGMAKIKVGDNEWVTRGRYVYEQHYGVKLSSKDRVFHIDRNRLNDDIDNLVVVTDGILARLNKLGLLTDDKELNGVIITKEKLLEKIREIENERKGKTGHTKKGRTTGTHNGAEG